MKYKTVVVVAEPVADGGIAGFFGSNVATDPIDLANNLEICCNNLAEEGFEVVSVAPLSKGDRAGQAGWDYTYALIVTAKKS